MATSRKSSRKSSKKSAFPRATVNKFKKIPTGVVTDTLSRLGIGGWMHGVYPVRGEGPMVGPAVTIRFGPARGVDQLPMTFYQIIRTFEPGSVLVIEAAGTDSSTHGCNIATCGQVQGLAGMVNDGRCRDFGEIGQLHMPVFCKGPTNRLPKEIELVAYNVPITCGGAQVNPGDIIMGDGDGVLVVPKGSIKDVLYQAPDVALVEADLERAVKTGAPNEVIAAVLKRKKIHRK